MIAGVYVSPQGYEFFNDASALTLRYSTHKRRPPPIISGIDASLRRSRIKQHLQIKSFCGTSANAVKTQVWVALCIYLLVAIMKKRLHLPGSLHTLLQILEVKIFERKPIQQLVRDAMKQNTEPQISNQVDLFKP